MFYVTKNELGVIQLWNNQPEYSWDMHGFYAWLPGQFGIKNEVPIDVSGNEELSSMFPSWRQVPCILELSLIDVYPTELKI